MNRMDRIFGASDEARVRFSHMEFQIILPGDYVRCAVTGAKVPMSDLKYWNVDRQEAYATVAIAFQRYRDLRAGRR